MKIVVIAIVLATVTPLKDCSNKKDARILSNGDACEIGRAHV